MGGWAARLESQDGVLRAISEVYRVGNHHHGSRSCNGGIGGIADCLLHSKSFFWPFVQQALQRRCIHSKRGYAAPCMRRGELRG